jgi:large subunit ribosomal protein L10
MAIKKGKKEEICKKVKDVVDDFSTVVFVNFHGLNVIDTTQLKSSLREDDSFYLVAKKSLVNRVLQDSSIKGEIPELDGELALAYSKDQIAPARGVFDFQKKHKEKISILGGIFEGAYVDKDKMSSIAQIPSLLTLRAQFVNLINSPIQGLVIALNQIAEKQEA